MLIPLPDSGTRRVDHAGALLHLWSGPVLGTVFDIAFAAFDERLSNAGRDLTA
jgi:hypothetical protein